ncbi:MAG: hypothetical protein IPK16_05815 [Anaerolineales bacterium]|nr:hypothetical protein [Anaerolineales bacterium]
MGGQVKAGDIIIEVATDKVDTEVPAAVDGVLLQINAHDGELVPVTSVFGYIGAEGEAVGGAPAAPAPVAATTSAPTPAASARWRKRKRTLK